MLGHLTREYIIKSDNDVSENEHFINIDYIIWDATNVGSISLDVDDMHLVATKDYLLRNQLNDDLKLAFVVSDAKLKSMIDDYIKDSIGWGTSWGLKEFDNLSDTQKWLDIKH